VRLIDGLELDAWGYSFIKAWRAKIQYCKYLLITNKIEDDLLKCHAHDFLAINMKLLLQTALLLLVGSASAFQNFAARYQAINTQLQAGYVPAGMTEKQYADYKKKEAQKAAAHKKKFDKKGKCGDLTQDVMKGKKTFVHLSGDALKPAKKGFFGFGEN
jgi:hypothetical protein